MGLTAREVLRRRSARAVAALGSAAVVTSLGSFLSLAFLARLLSQDMLGALVVAQASAALVFAVVDIRLEDALMHAVPRMAERRDGALATAVYQRAVGLDVATGLVLGLAVAGAAAAALHGDTSTASGLVALAALQQGARAGLGTVSAAFLLTGQAAAYARTTVAATGMATPLALLGAWFAGAAGYLVVDAVCGLLTVLVLAHRGGRLMRARHGPARSRVRAAELMGLVRFSVVTSFGGTLATAQDAVPPLLVGLVAGPEAAAQFRIALAPGRLVATAASPFVSVIFPRLSKMASQGRVAELTRLARMWTLFVAAPAVPVGLLLAAALPVLVPAVYGDAYRGAGAAAAVLAAAALARAAVAWGKVLPVAVGRPGVRVAALAAETVVLSGAVLLVSGDLDRVAAAYLVVTLVMVLSWYAFVPALSAAAARRPGSGA